MKTLRPRLAVLALAAMTAVPAWAQGTVTPCVVVAVKQGDLTVTHTDKHSESSSSGGAIIGITTKGCPETTWVVSAPRRTLDISDLLRPAIDIAAITTIGAVLWFAGRRQQPGRRRNRRENSVPDKTDHDDVKEKEKEKEHKQEPKEEQAEVKTDTPAAATSTSNNKGRFLERYHLALAHPDQRPDLVSTFHLVSLRPNRFTLPNRDTEGLDGPQEAELWGFRTETSTLVIPGPELYRRASKLAYDDCMEARFLLGEYFDIVPSERFKLISPAKLTAQSRYGDYTCVEKGLIHWA